MHIVHVIIGLGVVAKLKSESGIYGSNSTLKIKDIPS